MVRGALLSLAVCALSTLVLSSPVDRRLLPVGNTATGFPNPLDDPFYVAPENISSYKLGDIIRRRDTTSTFNTAASSYQIMYRSSDTQERAIGAVGTVLVPRKPNQDAGLLSFQNFEDSVSLTCSPSWAYVRNTNGPAQLAANLEAPIAVGWALQNGYHVVIPDHEGPDSAFIAGHTEGKIVLDGIRAATTAQNLPKDIKAGMYGYSGGAHATAWAATLHESYASDLNIVGASHSGTPIDPEHILLYLNKGFFAGFAIAGVVGMGKAYPELDTYVRSNLNAAGEQAFKTITARDTCIGGVIAGYPFTDLFSLFNVKDPLQTPIPRKYLPMESLDQNKASFDVPAPKFPRFIAHALFDEVIPYNDTQAYVTQQCNKGAGTIYAVTLPIAEHITGQVFSIASALDFLGKAFTGTLDKSVKCGSIIPNIDPGSAQAKQVLGDGLASQVSKAKNTGDWQKAVGLKHDSNNNATGIQQS
ncbi:unnamed protein product [Sympodiomycopsis kandeliae]